MSTSNLSLLDWKNHSSRSFFISWRHHSEKSVLPRYLCEFFILSSGLERYVYQLISFSMGWRVVHILSSFSQEWYCLSSVSQLVKSEGFRCLPSRVPLMLISQSGDSIASIEVVPHFGLEKNTNFFLMLINICFLAFVSPSLVVCCSAWLRKKSLD